MIWQDLARRALPREPVALISVLATEGSAPRGPGARGTDLGDQREILGIKPLHPPPLAFRQHQMGAGAAIQPGQRPDAMPRQVGRRLAGQAREISAGRTPLALLPMAGGAGGDALLQGIGNRESVGGATGGAVPEGGRKQHGDTERLGVTQAEVRDDPTIVR